MPLSTMSAHIKKPAYATFAGGCFWCMEQPFRKITGVIDVISGYTGGTGKNPTYQTYAQEGHVEAIQIAYDPAIASYAQLLDLFWQQIDPTDANGQFVDRGAQYRSVIFYHTPEQKVIAEESKKKLTESQRFSKPIVTEFLPATTFYPAEAYHQNYAAKNPIRYKFYRYRSGRDQFIQKAWAKKQHLSRSPLVFKKPSDEELKTKLTPIQYRVTQKDGTEPAFQNEYWNNKKPGIYVDVVSGEPLFSSTDMFDSGTGWPSFSKPISPDAVVHKQDTGWLSTRTEIRSKIADSHLGHVFNDGPQPTGLRYCMNSAALRFIDAGDLEKNGYSDYKKLFN